jgi:capsid protein
MPILEPDKEGLAYLRLVRAGAMTWGQMVRELGYDPTNSSRRSRSEQGSTRAASCSTATRAR